MTAQKSRSNVAATSGTKSVDAFIRRLPAEQQPLAKKLRALVHAAVPGIAESIKWRQPVFEKNGLVCYIASNKGYVRFGFFPKGLELDDPEGLLEGTGKSMRHVKIRAAQDIRPVFKKWVKAAAAMNTP